MNYKMFFLSIVLLSTQKVFSVDQQVTFKLITVLYNEVKPVRLQEYITCLDSNVANRFIDTIHVIYDTSKDDTENKLLNYIKSASSKIKIEYINHRPSYSDCFELANNLYSQCKIIVSNADIFFNDTLAVLERYDLTNKFLALTRWNVTENGTLELFRNPDKNGNMVILSSSQDVWIFESPLRKFQCGDICLGIMQCDSIIAYRAMRAGFIVKNPCLAIQCCHLHLSEKKNYGRLPCPYAGQCWLPVVDFDL